MQYTSLLPNLQGLVVLAAVLGMLNMAPASLHRELHTSHSRQELRRQTGAGGGREGTHCYHPADRT